MNIFVEPICAKHEYSLEVMLEVLQMVEATGQVTWGVLDHIKCEGEHRNRLITTLTQLDLVNRKQTKGDFKKLCKVAVDEANDSLKIWRSRPHTHK